MNINKAKRLLAKINVLIENHDEAFSTLENDLLKTYIKDLYECVSGLSEPVKEKQKNLDTKNKESSSHKLHQEKPSIAIPPPDETKQPYEIVQDDNIKAKPVQEIIEQIKTEKAPIPDKKIDSDFVLPIIKKEEISPVADSNGEQKPESKSVPQHVQKEMENLFTVQKGSDLLSKLGSKPVTLIENAMGINERIFTINELFQSDRDLFQKTVDTINRLENYDQAKEYLMEGIAKELNWASAEKIEKATEFIRLVQRKFISS